VKVSLTGQCSIKIFSVNSVLLVVSKVEKSMYMEVTIFKIHLNAIAIPFVEYTRNRITRRDDYIEDQSSCSYILSVNQIESCS
jgi:hypothetical protein